MTAPKPLEVYYEPPVELEHGSERVIAGDVLTVNGLLFCGDFFRHFAAPDPRGLYAIRRDGERVTAIRIGTLDAPVVVKE